MLSVLLAKPIVAAELVNDLNHWLINWWRCVRDEPEEMGRLTASTPRSRLLFNEACERARELPPDHIAAGIDDAMTFQTIIQQSLLHSWQKDSGRSNWGRSFTKQNYNPIAISHVIQHCAERLAYVQLECRDAIDLITAPKQPQTLIYCDPPYHSAHTEPYGEFQFDKDKFLEAVSVSPCQIMISGYPGEWDELGWHSVTRRTSRMPQIKDLKLEVLYMNFKPEQGRLL